MCVSHLVMKMLILYKRLLFIFKNVITSQCKGMTGLQIIAHVWVAKRTHVRVCIVYCIWTLIHVFGLGTKQLYALTSYCGE